MLRFALPVLSLTRRPTHRPSDGGRLFISISFADGFMGRSLALPIGQPLPAGESLGASTPWVGQPHRPSFDSVGLTHLLRLGGPLSLAYGLSLRAIPAPPTTPAPVPLLNRSERARQLTSHGGASMVHVQRALLSYNALE